MKRGRKSTTELATVAPIVDRRPEPPSDLPAAAAAVWRAVAGSKPGDWWRPDTLPLLRSYALHVARAAVLDAQIDAMKPEWLTDDDGLARLDTLLRMRDRETRAMLALARSMRLTQQSQVHRETAGRAHRDAVPDGPRPWEFGR